MDFDPDEVWADLGDGKHDKQPSPAGNVRVEAYKYGGALLASVLAVVYSLVARGLAREPATWTLGYLKSGVFWVVVYRKKRSDVMASHDVGIGYLGRAGGWGPVVPGVCTVHRLVLTPTVTTLEPHAALCPTIKFLLVAEETGGLIRDL